MRARQKISQRGKLSKAGGAEEDSMRATRGGGSSGTVSLFMLILVHVLYIFVQRVPLKTRHPHISLQMIVERTSGYSEGTISTHSNALMLQKSEEGKVLKERCGITVYTCKRQPSTYLFSTHRGIYI